MVHLNLLHDLDEWIAGQWRCVARTHALCMLQPQRIFMYCQDFVDQGKDNVRDGDTWLEHTLT